MKVLIIDADWRFVAQVTPYLEDRAHLVVHQTCPAAAAKQVQKWKPDLVVLAAELASSDLVQKIYNIPDRPAVLLTENMDRYAQAWRVWQTCGDELLMKPIFKHSEFHEAMIQAQMNATASATATEHTHRKAG